jgi:hypothetical protein
MGCSRAEGPQGEEIGDFSVIPCADIVSLIAMKDKRHSKMPISSNTRFFIVAPLPVNFKNYAGFDAKSLHPGAVSLLLEKRIPQE